eukprot:CAMPEP_0201592236 /NCGR_PEP_ID=MMETSP0190_2-20130828/190180_1 /ASSEMBLY_ACC=CAM_ASM_000263 /TAXON_ID=37353 /ORGANISM="Rosalina sp." /LENGTH=436 /DNA_ID=CAMNT_0048050907 /DNA_START=269 /DNA_END=1578 /DNA_ORIENTATION=+
MGYRILSVDDGNQHGIDISECANKYAGDITIPGSVSKGDEYSFLVGGYSNTYGDYTVQLFCITGNITPQPTLRPISVPVSNPVESSTSECNRHREPWHLLSDDERSLYINGFKELANQGKSQLFAKVHHAVAEHGNAAFLPWHRLFLWEFETQIRKLGGDYSCFALPYWDWTEENPDHDIKDWVILNSGLSGVGDSNDDDKCVTGNFGRGEYVPYDGDCLKRPTDPSGTISDASTLYNYMTQWENYGSYWNKLVYPHNNAHCAIGNGDTRGQLCAMTSPDDPIFYLIHSFVDMQWSLWQDCRNYEESNVITEAMYGDSEALDSKLNFGELAEADWTYLSENDMSIRDMYSIEDWKVSYDKGDFFDIFGIMENNECPQTNINSNWFKDVYTKKKKKKKNVKIKIKLLMILRRIVIIIILNQKKKKKNVKIKIQIYIY